MRWTHALVAAAIVFAARGANAEDCIPPAAPSKELPAQISVRAQSHFARHQWEDAARDFRDLSFNHPDFAAMAQAPQLYLQSINELGMKGRAACYDKMAVDVPLLVALHCDGEKSEKNAEGCELLDRVGADIDRLAAQRFVEEGDRTPNQSSSVLYERGGKKYFELFNHRCRDPVADGKPPRTTRCDEIAYNAARAFAAGRHIAKSISVYRALLGFVERTKMRSPLAEQAIYALGGSYEAIGVFDLAAEWYEKLAFAHPKTSEAPSALLRAVTLRLGTGSADEATRDARFFAKTYGAKEPQRMAEIAMAIATHHLEHDRFESARVTLASAMTIGDRAPEDVRVTMHTLLGRASARIAPAQAKQENERVRAMYRHRDEVISRILSGYLHVEERNRRVLATQAAFAEALYAIAEEKRKTDVDSLRRPVDARAKRAAIDETEAAYAEIFSIEPNPPSWSVAAARRIAFMWADFALDVPSLKEVKEEKAKPAMLRCLALAKKLEQGGADVRACEAWLARNTKNEIHVLDEIAPLLIGAATTSGEAPLRLP